MYYFNLGSVSRICFPLICHGTVMPEEDYIIKLQATLQLDLSVNKYTWFCPQINTLSQTILPDFEERLQ